MRQLPVNAIMTAGYSTIPLRVKHTRDFAIDERRTITKVDDLEERGRVACRLLSTDAITSVGAETIIDTVAKEND